MHASSLRVTQGAQGGGELRGDLGRNFGPGKYKVYRPTY